MITEKDIKNTKMVLKIYGFSVKTAPLLIQLSKQSSINVSTIAKNARMFMDMNKK